MKTPSDLPTIQDLLSGDPQTVADRLSMPVIWCDHQATRRQRLHGVNVPGEQGAYSSTHLNEVLDYVAKAGWSDAVLICETPSRNNLACYCAFQPLKPV